MCAASPNGRQANQKTALQPGLLVLQKGPPASGGTVQGLGGPSLPSAYSFICRALGSGRALFHVLGIQQGTKPSPCPDSPLRGTENKYFKN